MEKGNYDYDYDYEVGDTVYLNHIVVNRKGTRGRRRTCPAKYLGRFKDKFGLTGTVYCFKPIGSAEPYEAVRFKPEKVNGETLSSVIPFSSKPRCYGKVKR